MTDNPRLKIKNDIDDIKTDVILMVMQWRCCGSVNINF